MLARLLRDEPDDEEDDAILSVAQAYKPMSAQSANLALKGVDCDLVEVYLNLCTLHGAVQNSGHILALAVEGERSLWLSLSSIDLKYRRLSPVDSKELVSPAVRQ
ncbi:unnamed protein product [Leuciscus chuanchicus]